jgi:4'-phosphopantetheinyl transferase EntD
MIAEILLPDVSSAESYGDIDGAVLFPQEEPMIARAVASRRRTFTTGRACARRALGGLGIAPAAILNGEHGAPCWPAGVVGSITHCETYRAAAVARSDAVMCLGIDAEPNDVLSPRVLRRVALDQEQASLRELAIAVPGVAWDRLLFSAKEAVYKACYPLTGRRLDFAEMLITFDLSQGTFDARLLAPSLSPCCDMGGFSGRWLVGNDLVITAVAIPASEPSPGITKLVPPRC